MAAGITYTKNWGPYSRMHFGTAAPTVAGDGTYAVGDVIINTVPTAGGTFCWVCTTAGTPGTWKAVAIGA